MIEHKFDARGGFFAHDTETGATAYAYPTSQAAAQAKRNAANAASDMIRNLNPYMTSVFVADHASYLRYLMLND